MNCPSCRSAVGGSQGRCTVCGAVLGVPSEGALAPDLSRRSEPLREIPGLRKAQRTWRDEVRERVQTRRQARDTGEKPEGGEPAEVAEPPETLIVHEQTPEGTLVELGPASAAGPSPYAVTEKWERGASGPLELGEDGSDLPLGEPAAQTPDPDFELGEAPPARGEDAPPPAARPRFEDVSLADPEAGPEAAPADGASEAGGVGERVIAATIDVALWAAMAVMVVYFASRVAQVPVAGLRPAWPWLAGYVAFLGLAYAAWFTGSTGQTIGKIAAGLRVVDAYGRPPGYGRAFSRAVLGGIGTLAVFGGVVPVLLDRERRALHDRALGTRVVRA